MLVSIRRERGNDMGAVERALKAGWKEMKKPSSYVKGDEFELFIRTNLFPRSKYGLLYKNYDYLTSQVFSIETSREPDFKFKSVKTELEFFIEAKYRSRFYSGKLEWCKTYQLRRYQVLNKATPLFIVIGAGGAPSTPEYVFLVPMRVIKYTVLFQSFLRKFEVSTSNHISEEDLRILLNEPRLILY